MHDVSFEQALELIQAKDPRYQAEAYRFVREALDYTQKTIGRDPRGRVRHVTGQELLAGIRDFALTQFGPMAIAVLEEWGIHTCQDFGEIVFNMVETGGSPTLEPDDLKDPDAFAARLRKPADPLSDFLAQQLSPATRQGLKLNIRSRAFREVLLRELNEIIHSRPLYQKQRFAHVGLSSQTKCLLDRKLHGAQLALLNRLLLEDAYPGELAKSGGLLAKTDADRREDFADGYDFFEAFRKPFLPKARTHKPATAPAETTHN